MLIFEHIFGHEWTLESSSDFSSSTIWSQALRVGQVTRLPLIMGRFGMSAVSFCRPTI